MPDTEDLPRGPHVAEETQDGGRLDVEPAVFDEVHRGGWAVDAVPPKDGGRDLILKRTKVQRPGSVVPDQEVYGGVTQITYAVKDDEGVVHVDNNGNKLAEQFVISMEGFSNNTVASEVLMQFPDLEMFTRGAHDPEGARYQIMAALETTAKQFHRSRLYPVLGDLVELVSILETVRDNKEQYGEVMPRRLTGVDFESKSLKFDTEPANPKTIEQLFELIDWALPEVKKITDEGVAMFDFVNANLSIDVVGIMPIYRDEGYAFVTDRKDSVLHVLRYEMSIFSDNDDAYRALKTFEVETRAIETVIVTPEDVKLQLIQSHKDLPNPATYMVDTDLDFPFDATILPVAKRKLMKQLIS